MKKKLISLALGLSMLAAVTGCSSKKKETEAETKAATEAVATEAAKETEAVTEAAPVEEVTEAAAAVEEVTEAAAVEEVTEAAAVEEITEAAAVEEVTEAAAVEEVTEAVETEAVTEAPAEPETEVVTEAAAVEEVTEAATEVVTEVATEAATEIVTEAVTEVATEAATEIVTEAATEVVTEVATEAATEIVTEAATEVVTEVVTEAATEIVTEAVTEAAAEPETEVVTEIVTEAVTEAAAEPETEVVTEAVTEIVTEAATEIATEAATEAATEIVTEAVTEVAEEVVTEAAEIETEAVTEEAEFVLPAVFTAVPSEESVTGTLDDMDITENDVVVLYVNDVHGGVSSDKNYSGSSLSLGYAGLAAVKEDAMGKAAAVTTVDLGDAIQGSVVTTETDGQAVMDLMDKIGFDIRIPGNHEFDYGMDLFLDYAEKAGTFLSSNFIDNRTDESIFEGYTVIDYEVAGQQLKVGYVGMTTPETLAKSTPTYFQDEDGNYIYGFDAETPQDLYNDVQEDIDAAYADGADIVIGLGHMGDSGVEPGWSSVDVIGNTTGMSAFLDGHAHNIIPGMMVQDKEGNDVLLSSTGTKLEHIGVMKMNVAEDGTVTLSTGLVDEITEDEEKSISYTEVDDLVKASEEEFAYLFVEIGNTDFELVIYDPVSGDRLIRNSETNMGNFLSDVYRNYFGTDIAVLNGGSIRANIDAGPITYMDLITVYPWNTTTGVIKVTGQTVLDMLEMGAHLYPEECGGWIQPSGMTYMIDTTIPSSVNVNSDGEFVSVDGEYRVKNVMIGDEPLDLEKEYTLAINSYYSQEYGDGMTMFKDCEVVVPADGEEWMVDHDVVIDYLDQIGGNVPEEYEDPYGEGRIVIITEENKDLLEAAEEAISEAVETAEEAVSEAAEAAEEAVSEALAEAEELLSEAEAKIG